MNHKYKVKGECWDYSHQQSEITRFLQEISSKRSNEKQTSDEPGQCWDYSHQQSGITKFLQEIGSKRSNEKQTTDEPQVQGSRPMLGLFSAAIRDHQISAGDQQQTI